MLYVLNLMIIGKILSKPKPRKISFKFMMILYFICNIIEIKFLEVEEKKVQSLFDMSLLRSWKIKFNGLEQPFCLGQDLFFPIPRIPSVILRYDCRNLLQVQKILLDQSPFLSLFNTELRTCGGWWRAGQGEYTPCRQWEVH